MNHLIVLTTMVAVSCPPHFSGRSQPSRVYYHVEPAAAVAVEPEKPKEKSLYDRLGGEKAIHAVVDDLVGRLAANPKVNITRKGIEGARVWEPTPENVAKVNKLLFQLVCHVTGGPQKYEGRSMKESHKGLKITPAQFDASMDDIKATLKKFNVPKQETEEFLKIVESTRKDIVEE